MSRAVIFNIISDQDPLPMLEFAAALVRCGEEVTFYASEAYRAAAQFKGAAFRAYDGVETLQFTNKIALGVQLIQASHQLLPGILERLSKERPDYLIFDSRSVWGWYVSRILKIPAISVFTAPVINREVLIRSGKVSGELSGFWRHLEEMSQYRKIVSELEQTYKITGPSISTILYNRGEFNLVQTIDTLQPWASSLDDSYRFIGVNEELLTQTNVKLVIARDATDITSPVSQAFAEASRKDPAIIKEASWLVTHGEMPAIHQALLEGRLLIIVPRTVEQDIVAEHISQLGVGIRLGQQELHQLEAYLNEVKPTQNGEYLRTLQNIKARITMMNSTQTMLNEISSFKQIVGLTGLSV